MPSSRIYYGAEVSAEFYEKVERERAMKKVERSNAAKVMRRFANKVKTLGFARKSTWFAREADLCIQFLHVHKYSFGPCFRLHYGVRILNDDNDYVTLGGPAENQGLEFGEDSDSLDQCAGSMYALVTTTIEPWFKNQTYEKLLEGDSCLYPEERDALRRALAGRVDDSAARQSRELFGLG